MRFDPYEAKRKATRKLATSEADMEQLKLLGKAMNALTQRWVEDGVTGPTVLSAVGAWPLLAILSGAADGAARDELCAAVGLPASEANAAALKVLEWLQGDTEAHAAIGCWFKKDITLKAAWTSSLPPDVVQKLLGTPEDAKELDRWAARKTGGMIRTMSPPKPETDFVMATALALKFMWEHKFDQRYKGDRPKVLPNGTHVLTRSSRGAQIFRACPDLTAVCIQGQGEYDVHLLLGTPDMAPATVLSRGMSVVSAVEPLTTESAAHAAGPGLVVGSRDDRSGNKTPYVQLQVPGFRVKASHDLLEYSRVFGLGAATGLEENFPTITAQPLMVTGASQMAVAHFTANGFAAAAITRTYACGARPPQKVLAVPSLEFTIDRPFGFLVAHRLSGTVMFAGWVTENEMTR